MIMEIQVLPTPMGTADEPYAYVDAAIAAIAGSGLAYEVGALGTVVEGEADDIWDLDWMTKLAGQFVAAGLIAWLGVQIYSLRDAGMMPQAAALGSVAIAIIIICNTVVTQLTKDRKGV